jgi:hypothetical protein
MQAWTWICGGLIVGVLACAGLCHPGVAVSVRDGEGELEETDYLPNSAE